ncbi:MAG: hypothetical protein IJ491_05260 [Clostridia bacterium]|nr:hypothetical protein [Clostridia bacterium]
MYVGDVMICAFFGHRSCPFAVEETLEEEIEKLLLSADVDTFYVGNKGAFDRFVQSALRNIKERYPYIKMFIVLDYIPTQKVEFEGFEIIIPDSIENVPKRFIMSYRNKWMINECDVAIVYCVYTVGNTQRHVDMLKRKGKEIFNIADKIFEYKL